VNEEMKRFRKANYPTTGWAHSVAARGGLCVCGRGTPASCFWGFGECPIGNPERKPDIKKSRRVFIFIENGGRRGKNGLRGVFRREGWSNWWCSVGGDYGRESDGAGVKDRS